MDVSWGVHRWGANSLFDGEFAFLALFANGLVNPAIGTAADEADNVIFVSYSDFAGIPYAG